MVLVVDVGSFNIVIKLSQKVLMGRSSSWMYIFIHINIYIYIRYLHIHRYLYTRMFMIFMCLFYAEMIHQNAMNIGYL